jgi:hypothetical protein
MSGNATNQGSESQSAVRRPPDRHLSSGPVTLKLRQNSCCFPKGSMTLFLLET